MNDNEEVWVKFSLDFCVHDTAPMMVDTAPVTVDTAPVTLTFTTSEEQVQFSADSPLADSLLVNSPWHWPTVHLLTIHDTGQQSTS